MIFPGNTLSAKTVQRERYGMLKLRVKSVILNIQLQLNVQRIAKIKVHKLKGYKSGWHWLTLT